MRSRYNVCKKAREKFAKYGNSFAAVSLKELLAKLRVGLGDKI